MGIIVLTTHGMGADGVQHISQRVKVVNLMHESMEAQELVDDLVSKIDGCDIALVPLKREVVDELCLRNIDFDVFYPSKERRIEIIEAMVRDRNLPGDIAETDRNFNETVDFVDSNDCTCCHKHKLTGERQSVTNNPMLLEYISGIESGNQNGQ